MDTEITAGSNSEARERVRGAERVHILEGVRTCPEDTDTSTAYFYCVDTRAQVLLTPIRTAAHCQQVRAYVVVQ